MKTILTKKIKQALCACMLISITGTSQNFTWKKGSSIASQPGFYGTVGVAAPPNTPGAREMAYSWKDASGNFWIYGGAGYDGGGSGSSTLLADLWKFNPASNNWTYMNGDSSGLALPDHGTLGVPASSNKPGARLLGTSWADASGNLWLFGGYAMDATFNFGEMNDLWKYNISSNQWTWVSGSNSITPSGYYGTQGTPSATNVPGGRVGAVGWTDATGKFWLFGGVGYDGGSNHGYLDDLWKFDPATNQWTWVKGHNAVDTYGSYGSLGVSSATNNPGGRGLGGTWTDASGKFWMLGGTGLATTGPDDNLNDLWRYDMGTNQWTWMSGDSATIVNGKYGTLGVPSATNCPGARAGMITWTDQSGNLSLFSGMYTDTINNTSGYLNDIWRFNPVTSEWTWLNGSNSQNQPGVYGTLGVPASTNIPGARFGANSWKDASGNIWIFGGEGIDEQSSTDVMNDLWKLDACAVPNVSIASTNTITCSGQTVILAGAGASTYTWSTGPNTSTISVTPTVTTTYTLNGTAQGCSAGVVYTHSVNALPSLTISSNKAVICANEGATLSVSGASLYAWSIGGNGPTVVVHPAAPTTYTVSGTDGNGCTSTATVSQAVNACVGIDDHQPDSGVALYPNPNNGEFVLKAPGSTRVVVYNSLGQTVLTKDLNEIETAISSPLSKGIYIYSVMNNEKTVFTGRMIVQ